MSLQTLPVKTNTVPANFCFGGYNTPSWPELVGLMYVQAQEGNGMITVSASEPAPDDRGYPWLKLTATGYPDRMYYYTAGKWLAKHPMPEGIVTMYCGNAAAIGTLDEGDGAAVAVTDTSGPFWQPLENVYPDIVGRVPCYPGLPTGGTTTVTLNGTFGAETHTLTSAEMGDHSHPFGNWIGDDDCEFFYRSMTTFTPTINTIEVHGNTGSPNAALVGQANLVTGQKCFETAVTGHSNLQPMYGIYLIVRTARLYYRGT